MSTLHVENLKGPTSGANANKIIVPSGQALTAPGHVIQVVSTTSSTSTTMTAINTWTNIEPTVTITPTSTSSKILISHSSSIMMYNDPQNHTYRITRGGSQIWRGGRVYMASNGAHWQGHWANFMYLDSPATTSATTYQMQMFQDRSTAAQIRHNNDTSAFTTSYGDTEAVTIAMEIAA